MSLVKKNQTFKYDLCVFQLTIKCVSYVSFFFFVQLLTQNQQRHITCGIPRVDNAQRSGAAVAPRLIQGPLQLADVQTPALLFIQIVVDLHCPKFSQRS